MSTHLEKCDLEAKLDKLASVIQQTIFYSQETYNEQEAAQYLHCTLNALRYYSLRTRQLKYCLVGRNRVYRKVDLDTFLLSVRR